METINVRSLKICTRTGLKGYSNTQVGSRLFNWFNYWPRLCQWNKVKSLISFNFMNRYFCIKFGVDLIYNKILKVEFFYASKLYKYDK